MCRLAAGSAPGYGIEVTLEESDSAALEALYEVRDVLTYSFDLELLSAPRAPEWFHCLDGECHVIGCDATAGAYAVVRNEGSQRVVHVDQLGRTRVLGQDVMSAVALVVALPYWRELDEQLGDAAVDGFRDRAALLEREVQSDIVQLAEARQWLQARFDGLVLADPVANFARWRAEARPNLVTVAGWARISERPESANTDLHGA